jgi:hypothetical protein
VAALGPTDTITAGGTGKRILLPDAQPTLTVWDAYTSGNQVTDLLQGGSPVSVVTPNAVGHVVFQGPDGQRNTLYLDSGGVRYPVDPIDTATKLAAVDSTVAGLAAFSVSDAADVDTAGRSDGHALYYDSAEDEHYYAPVPTAGDFATSGHTHPYLLQGVVIENGGSVPGDLPSSGLVFELEPITFGFGQLVGTATGTSVSSRTITPAATLAANTLLVLGLVTGSADVTASVTDSAGNTWASAGSRIYQASTVTSQLFYSRITTQLTTSSTITVTLSASTGHVAAVCASVVGSVASPLDKSAGQGQNNTTSPSSGATATLASSPQIGFGCIGYNPTDRTFTPASGWTLSGSASTGSRACYLIHRQVSTTGAVTASGTITGATVNTASTVATFKG